VTVSSLRRDLLEIPGIQTAELEGDAAAPSGVRVQLSAGVDAQLVGEEVRRVLAAHGLRSEVGEPAASPVVAISDRVPSVPMVQPDPLSAAADEPAVAPPVLVETVPATEPHAPGILDAIAVEEGRDGVSVVARADDGRTRRRRARTGADGLDEAVVTAVAMLVDPEGPVPRIVSVGEREIEGTIVLTLVLEADGSVVVGSAVVSGGRPYAVGRAAWAALLSS